MPKNIMVKYVGPKKHIHVPFPEDGSFPLVSGACLHDVIRFPRNEGVELSPERAEALLEQSPGVFKVWGPPIKAVTVRKPIAEANDVKGNTSPVLEDSELSDHHTGDGEGV